MGSCQKASEAVLREAWVLATVQMDLNLAEIMFEKHFHVFEKYFRVFEKHFHVFEKYFHVWEARRHFWYIHTIVSSVQVDLNQPETMFYGNF